MEDLKKKLKIYIDSNLIENNRAFKYTYENLDLLSEMPKYRNTGSNIKDFIDEHKDNNDFQTMLFKFIDNKNLKDSDVYNRVHIDRRLFSKIRNENYHPSKETIILLAIALELTENELDELLDSASYSLPKNNKYDLIIRFCFINKIFNILDINELLYEYNCKLFNY